MSFKKISPYFFFFTNLVIVIRRLTNKQIIVHFLSFISLFIDLSKFESLCQSGNLLVFNILKILRLWEWVFLAAPFYFFSDWHRFHLCYQFSLSVYGELNCVPLMCDTIPEEIWTNIYSPNGYNWGSAWWTNEFCWLLTWIKVHLQEQKWIKDGCITKAHPAWMAAHKSWKPGAPYTACRQLNRLASPISRKFSWSEPLPGSLTDLCLCKEAGLVWTFRQVSFRVS